MPVTPEGLLSLPLHYLRLSLANSARLRTWFSVADEAAALAKIYINSTPPPAGNRDTHRGADIEALRPYCIVWLPDSDNERDAVGPHAFRAASRVGILFEANVASGLNHSDAWLTFFNNVGVVLEEIGDLSGTAGYLAMTDWNLISWARSTPDIVRDIGDAFQAEIMITVDN